MGLLRYSWETAISPISAPGGWKKAAELLRTTDLKVIEIANSVGYENQWKFARVFADRYSVSPLEFRRLSQDSLHR